MDEQKHDGMKSGGRCICGCDGSGTGCACGWHHGHSLFRVLLGLIILAMVFWFGVRMGEMRQMIRSGYGYGANYYGDQYSGVPMMRVYQSGGTGSSTTTGR